MWFPFALANAVLGAITTIYTKHTLKSVNASVMTLALTTLNFPLILIAVFLTGGIPQLSPLFFIAALGSALLYIASKTISLSVIKSSQLSQVAPLSAISVIASYVFSVVLLKEHVSTIPLLGLLLITAGVYILNVSQIKAGLLAPFKILFTHRSPRLYIISMIIGSLVANFDKISLNHMQPVNPALLLVVQNVFITIGLLIYIRSRRINWIQQFKSNLTHLTLVSLIYALTVIMAFYGFSHGPIALTVGIMNTRVLLILILSFIFFKDKPTRYTIIGSIITMIGVILTKTT